MTEDYINYPNIIDAAMRGVVREAMRRITGAGIPGDHHFFITFNTVFPGVKISEVLRQRYPREMTIVLQHQFWDFKVEEHGFTVTLSFSGVPEKLIVPFAAMTAFADPSVKFGLQFQPLEGGDAEIEIEAANSETPPAAKSRASRVKTERPKETIHEDDEEAATEVAGAEIISLDSFRKK